MPSCRDEVFLVRLVGPEEIEERPCRRLERIDLVELAVHHHHRNLDPGHEIERIYDRFDTLLRTGESLVHMSQFQLVADAFLLGRRVVVEPFND